MVDEQEKWRNGDYLFPLQPLNLPVQLFNQLLHCGILITQFMNCADVAGGVRSRLQVVNEVAAL